MLLVVNKDAHIIPSRLLFFLVHDSHKGGDIGISFSQPPKEIGTFRGTTCFIWRFYMRIGFTWKDFKASSKEAWPCTLPGLPLPGGHLTWSLLNISIHLSIYLSTYLSIHPSIYLSLYIYTCVRIFPENGLPLSPLVHHKVSRHTSKTIYI